MLETDFPPIEIMDSGQAEMTLQTMMLHGPFEKVIADALALGDSVAAFAYLGENGIPPEIGEQLMPRGMEGGRLTEFVADNFDVTMDGSAPTELSM